MSSQLPPRAGTEISALNLQNLGISSLDGMPSWQTVEILNLKDNRLVNMYGIPTMVNLKFLHLDSNNITSFLGMSHQPQIEILTMENNPICHHPHFRIMAMLACGETLRIINYRVVTEEERKICVLLGGSGSMAARAVSLGWTDLQLREKPEQFYADLMLQLREEYTQLVQSMDTSMTIYDVLVQHGLLAASPARQASESQQDDQREPQWRDASGGRSERHPFGMRSMRDPPSPIERRGSPPRDHFGYGAARSPIGDEDRALTMMSFSDAVESGAAYLRRGPDSDEAPRHATGQLTLQALTDFYRTTGMPHDVRLGNRADGVDERRERDQWQRIPSQCTLRRGAAPSGPSTPSPMSKVATIPALASQWGTASSYGAAVEAARRYKEHFQRSGTIRGAAASTMAPLPPAPDARPGHLENWQCAEEEKDPGTPQKRPTHDQDPALLLLQSEIGCLASLLIDNVDVKIAMNGVTVVPQATCKISGSSGRLYVYEAGDPVFATEISACRDIELDKAEGCVKLLGAVSVPLAPPDPQLRELEAEYAAAFNQPVRDASDRRGTVHIFVRSTPEDGPSAGAGSGGLGSQSAEPRGTGVSARLREGLARDAAAATATASGAKPAPQVLDATQRGLLAKGIFKMLMLFKCTPSELATFYSRVVITEAKTIV